MRGAERIGGGTNGSIPDPLIRLDGLSVGFESATVLRDLSFEIPRRGLVALMGPGGVGKTTLLRTLGRWNEALPSFWRRGSILLEGRDLQRQIPLDEAQARIPLLAQKARLYTATVGDNAIAELRGTDGLTSSKKRELAHQALAPRELWDEFESVLDEPVHTLSIGGQRKLAIARLTAGPCQCLLVDEPLRDLSPDDARELEALLSRLGEERSVVMITHNQLEARRMCGLVCLITAGRLVEATPTAEFFDEPRTELGREFLRTGNCWPAEEKTFAGSSSPAPTAAERAVRPSGFHWIIRGLLGGTQWPGLVSDEKKDLEGLAALGTQVLVSLTETRFDARRLGEMGIAGEHFPIADMGAPDFDAAVDICDRISSWMDEGRPVVLHCKAGLGRTGTMLACTLVSRGDDAVSAVNRVRCTNPLYIQSEEQLAFVGAFAHRLDREPRGDG